MLGIYHQNNQFSGINALFQKIIVNFFTQTFEMEISIFFYQKKGLEIVAHLTLVGRQLKKNTPLGCQLVNPDLYYKNFILVNLCQAVF